MNAALRINYGQFHDYGRRISQPISTNRMLVISLSGVGGLRVGCHACFGLHETCRYLKPITNPQTYRYNQETKISFDHNLGWKWLFSTPSSFMRRGFQSIAWVLCQGLFPNISGWSKGWHTTKSPTTSRAGGMRKPPPKEAKSHPCRLSAFKKFSVLPLKRISGGHGRPHSCPSEIACYICKISILGSAFLWGKAISPFRKNL